MESEDLPLYILTVKCLGFSRMKESIRPNRWNTIFNERRQEAFEHSTKGCIFDGSIYWRTSRAWLAKRDRLVIDSKERRHYNVCREDYELKVAKYDGTVALLCKRILEATYRTLLQLSASISIRVWSHCGEWAEWASSWWATAAAWLDQRPALDEVTFLVLIWDCV